MLGHGFRDDDEEVEDEDEAEADADADGSFLAVCSGGEGGPKHDEGEAGQAHDYPLVEFDGKHGVETSLLFGWQSGVQGGNIAHGANDFIHGHVAFLAHFGGIVGTFLLEVDDEGEMAGVARPRFVVIEWIHAYIVQVNNEALLVL